MSEYDLCIAAANIIYEYENNIYEITSTTGGPRILVNTQVYGRALWKLKTLAFIVVALPN